MAIIWVRDKKIKNNLEGFIDGSTKRFYVIREETNWKMTCPDGTIVIHSDPEKIKLFAAAWLMVQPLVDPNITTEKI